MGRRTNLVCSASGLFAGKYFRRWQTWRQCRWWLCHNFARTIWHYMFGSVKSTGWDCCWTR